MRFQQSITHVRSVLNTPDSIALANFLIQELRGNGSNHIIKNSFLGSDLRNSGTDISDTDSRLFITLLSLGSRMSREERDKFAYFISLMRDKIIQELDSTNANQFVRIPLPMSSYAMRKIFETGKRQFTNYMPLPPILSRIPGYASVPLLKTLQIINSRGINFDKFETKHNLHPDSHQDMMTVFNPRKITGGSLFKTMASKVTIDCDIIQPIVIWLDAADLNKVKNNRSSVKVHNVYILHIDGQSSECVFPLALGTGRSEHDHFRRMMFEEITEMHRESVPCFDRAMKMTRNVQFRLLAVVQDCPEHSEFIGSIGHNGNYGLLPGFSFPRAILQSSLTGVTTSKNLVSCSTCFSRRVRTICSNYDHMYTVTDSTDDECSNCCDWNVMQVRFQRPSRMPVDLPDHCYENGDNNQRMLSRRITFETMLFALQYIHNKTYKKEWTDYSKTVQYYASLECISGSVAKGIYINAKNLRIQHTHDGVYDPNTIPPMDVSSVPCSVTSGAISIDQCMVGIMHTLFLNGGKKVMLLIHDVFKRENVGAHFLTDSKVYFSQILSLSLNWVMAWPFGSTGDKPMAPWVSENYVAFHHVSKSFISIVLEKLTRKGRPTVARNLKLVVSVWHRLLSIVMQPALPTPYDIAAVRDLAKLSLSKYHEMELILGRTNKEWDLQNASCHLMLLLLPEYMTNFGCLRNFWGGGHMGERSVTHLKKSLPHGAHMDGSVKSAIRRYFIEVVLSELVKNEHNKNKLKGETDDFISEEGDDSCNDEPHNSNKNSTKTSYDRYRRFHCYKSLESIIESFRDAKPIAMTYSRVMSSLYVLSWGSLSSKRQRLMYKLNATEGTTREGTYLLKLGRD